MYDESTRKLPHTLRPHRRAVDQAAHPDGNLIDYPRNPVPAERVARTCPTCGYTATYASEPLANYHHPRHSCAKAQRFADAARRRTIGGPIRDCQHRGQPHLHGTRTAYVKDQCRCTECRAANSAASKAAYRRTRPRTLGAVRRRGTGQSAHRDPARGRHRRRPDRPAGRHLLQPRPRTRPPRTNRPATDPAIRPETAQRLLAIAVTDANRASRSHVDATGTRRRLQALVAIGWTHRRWPQNSAAAQPASHAL